MNLGATIHKQVYRFCIFWNKKFLFTVLLVLFGMNLFPQIIKQSDLQLSSNSRETEDSIFLALSIQNYGNLLVGDYDNDSDYDIYFSSAFWELVPGICITNQEAGFKQVDLSLENVYCSGRGQAWGDIDNDNDLDLIISGADQNNSPVSKIYRNDGEGNYSEIDASIERVSESATAFGDLDNDGDQDLIISGLRIDGKPIAKIYLNIGKGVFIESEIAIKGLSAGSILICDLDSDMDNDVVMNGYDINKKSETVILRNDKQLEFTILEDMLPGIAWGMWSAADINKDGLLDLIGVDAAYEYLYASVQSKGLSFTSYRLHGSSIENSRLDLGDYDNDGNMDIVLSTGMILRNNGGANPATQFEIDNAYPRANVPGDVACLAWFNSQSNDILFSSSIDNGAVLFKGDTAIEKPTEPQNLKSRIFDKTTLLSWSRPQNPSSTMGLTYNLRVGKTPGGCEILSPMSDSMGFHKIDDLGNCSMSEAWKLENLPPGEYYWSIQTIDCNHVGSSFAEEQSFEVQPDYRVVELGGDSISTFGDLSPVDIDNDGDYDLFCTADVYLPDTSIQRAYGVMKKEADSIYVFENLGVLEEGFQIQALAFNDFNQDGYADLALSLVQEYDFSDSVCIFKLLKNSQGEELIVHSTRSENISVSDIQWLDYDNDGDSDYCLIGSRPDGLSKIELYRNDSSQAFTHMQEIDNLNYSNIRASINDFNSDGRMDLLVLGDSLSKTDGVTILPVAKFFQSGPNGWSESSEFELPPAAGRIDVSDFNNDGFLDFIDYGSHNEYIYGLNLYENVNGNGLYEVENSVKGVNLFGFAKLGDHNLDDQSDLYIFQRAQNSLEYDLKVYEKEGFSFREKSIYIEGELSFDSSLNEKSFSLVDMDGDSDLDVLLNANMNGEIHTHSYLRNDQSYSPYTVPKPNNLSHSRNRNSVVLNWDATEGNAHYYNVKVGTTPGGIDIVSPQSDPETGFLRIPTLGNAECNTRFLLDSLADGAYYWSVQAISKNKVGGKWSVEDSFGIVGDFELDFEVEGNCTGDSVSFLNRSVGTATKWHWDFGDGGASELRDPNYFYTQPGEYEVTLTADSGVFKFVFSKILSLGKGIELDFDYEKVARYRDVPFFNLTDTIGIGTTSWLWDFGDNSTYSGFTPGTHYYARESVYAVSLTAVSAYGCADSISKEVSMCNDVLEKPDLFVGGKQVWYLACSYAKHYQWFYNGDTIHGATENVYVPGDQMGSYYVKVSKNRYCWTPSDTVTIPLNDSDTINLNTIDQVEIYPNPSKGTIHVQMDNSLNGELHIEIFTIHGSKVYGQSYQKETSFFSKQLEFFELTPGVYFISIRIGDAKIEQRLLIE